MAGSDSGGGAGIQADLKTMNAFGVHGCSVVTAITAQNTRGVNSVAPVEDSMLREQLDALAGDLPPDTIKTGMLGNADCCAVLADVLETLPAATPLICDPVLKSTSGRSLLDPEAIDLLKHRIFPRVEVLTPNLPETEALLGHAVESVEAAAEELLQLGVHSVLIKGGHAAGAESRDYWTDGTRSLWLTSPRLDTRHTHGTGCILSSAIASAIALGQTIPEAIASAKTFLNQCLKAPAHIGAGYGPMCIERFLDREEDRPLIRAEV